MIRAKSIISRLAVSVATMCVSHAANADTNNVMPDWNVATAQSFIDTPNNDSRARYSTIFSALRDQNWDDAKARITAMDARDPMRSVALSELYLAKGSPRVEMFDLLDLLNKANWLPKADQLARLAEKRGATMLPTLPQIQKMVWLGAAPRREYIRPTKTDALAQALTAQIQAFVKADNPAGAEALLANGEAGLSPQGLAEVRQRVAWSYYIENDDVNARRMAARALEVGVGGDWTVHAHWTNALSAWRQNQYAEAALAFASVAQFAGDPDMRAAGAYWAARANMANGQPQKVASLLRLAAGATETFYGLLARETLGLPLTDVVSAPSMNKAEWQQLKDQPNVTAAISFASIGENGRADEFIRHQAKLGGTTQYDALLKLTNALNLPQTQLWLAHNGPAGKQPATYARFPAPAWRPDGGWRVDPSLIYAHTLQESGFRADAVSSVGARGLMQVRPGTGSDMGLASASQLFVPSTNMEFGQRYLETLRDMNATGGLLPKIMAAYNAGPVPVQRWATEVKDNGDPLLYMESLPYYETRAYVNIVMRNFWMYQVQAKGAAESLTGMAQGLWPTFPTAKGSKMVRMSRTTYDLASSN